MKDRKYLTVILIIIIMLGLGCTGKDDKKLSEEDIIQITRQTPTIINKEEIGGIYNTSILDSRKEYKGNVQTWQQIEYTKDGKTIRGDLYPGLRDSLDWIKQNTLDDAILMNWWDYGDSIIGYTGRDSVIRYTSKELLDTISMYKYVTPEKKKEMEDATIPHEKIQDVSKVLTSENSQDAIKIMKKYNAEYLFVHSNDTRLFSIFQFAIEGIWKEPNKDDIDKTIVGMASKGLEIEGFKLVYSDKNVRLYKILLSK